MSMNIPKVVMDVTTKVELTVDTELLGTRQRSALRRMTDTGIIKGYSVPVLIARRLRRESGYPTIHMERYGRIKFWNFSPDANDFYAEMMRGVGVAVLEHTSSDDGQRDWRQEEIDRAIALATERRPNGYLLHIGEHFNFSKVKLPKLPMPDIPRFITVDWQQADSDWQI